MWNSKKVLTIHNATTTAQQQRQECHQQSINDDKSTTDKNNIGTWRQTYELIDYEAGAGNDYDENVDDSSGGGGSDVEYQEESDCHKVESLGSVPHNTHSSMLVARATAEQGEAKIVGRTTMKGLLGLHRQSMYVTKV